MFTINSNYKKILKKLLVLLSIFTIINIVLFVHLRDYSIGYRPLDTKARALFKMYPAPKVIIGGDSTAESNIIALTLHPSSVNIATPASGIAAFVKALKLYHPKPFTKDNIIIVNLSVLATNDRIINVEKYIGQIDDFLNIGAFYLLKEWKTDFFGNLFNVYRCKFSSCPFYLDLAYPDIYQTIDHGFRAFMPTLSTLEDKKKKFDDVYYEYFKQISTNGVLFESYRRNLKALSQTGAKIVIVHLPFSSNLKSANGYLTKDLFQDFISRGKKECQYYANCTFLDYINWDNLNLGNDENAMFSDLTHLSPEGAKNFSIILKKDLQNALKDGGINDY